MKFVFLTNSQIMEENKYPILSWSGEGDEDEEDEEEWKSCRLILPKRPNNGFICGSSSPPAKKRLKIDSFCTLREACSSAATDPPSEVFLSRYNHKRTIIHIDIDCFYAQVEMILDPSLRNKPVGIQQKHIIVTCNYIARERGLTKLMRLSDAKKKCPDLVLVNGENLSEYRDFSKKVNDILKKITPYVERLGFDESFLDVTDLVETRLQEILDPSGLIPNGIVYAEKEIAKEKICACDCHQRLTVGSQLAAQVRKKIFEEIGLTCCAGIAHNKLLAKLVGECNKPNKQTLLFPEFADKFLKSLPARRIPGIGTSSSKRLQSMGVSSVLELQTCPLTLLQSEFGEGLAIILKKLSHGIDDAGVIASGAQKSMSEEDTYRHCSSVKEVRTNLQKLAASLLLRLTDDIGYPLTVRLTIRQGIGELTGYRKESRQGPIPSNFSSTKMRMDQKVSLLLSLSLELFKRLVNIKQPFNIKLLNVCLTNFHKPSKCGSKALSSFFTITQSETKAVKSAKPYPEGNYEEYQNDDKNNAGDHTRKRSSCFEVEYPFYNISKPFTSSNSENHPSFKETVPVKDQVVSKNQQKESCKVIPSDVDPEVFNSLPLDVQRELIEQWKQEKKSTVKKQIQNQPEGLLKYFSKTL